MKQTSVQAESARIFNWQVPAAIFALALVVRLMFLFSSGDAHGPHSKWYEGDAPIWVEWAAALDEDRAFQFNLPIHPPAVAFALAFFYDGARLAGFTAIRVLWCAMSAAACALLYLCCLPLGNRVSLIAAGLCTFSFGQYVLATSLNSEAPYTLMLCAIVLITQHMRDHESLWWAAGLGFLHGLANLLRPEHTLLLLLWFGVPLLPTLFRRSEGRAWGQANLSASVVLLAFGLTVLPWTVQASRNVRIFNTLAERQPDFEKARVAWTDAARTRLKELPPMSQADNVGFVSFMAQREGLGQVDAEDIDRILLREFGTIPKPLSPWVLVSNQGGLSFALANDPRSDGGFSRAMLAHPLIGNNPTFRFSFPPHVRLINEGYAVGWNQIKSDPSAWAKLVIRKLQRFADGATGGFTALNLPLGREGVREPVDMFTARGVIEPYSQLLMIAVFVGGAVVAVARRVAVVWLLIIGYKIAVTILFYGYARQAASTAPAFFVLTALALDWILLQAPTSLRWAGPSRWLIAGLVLAIALAIEIHGARTAERFVAQGNLNPKPEWGKRAFQSYERVTIKRASLE